METKTDEEQEKIAAFVEISGEGVSQARQFLQATNWQLEEAIQLYFEGNSETAATSGVQPAPVALGAPAGVPSPAPTAAPELRTESSTDHGGESYVRPPLPVKREVLYEDIFQYRAHRMAQTSSQPTSVDAFRNFEDEANQRAAWAVSDANTSSSSGLGGMRDSLAALYRPPFVLMFQGTFEQAKGEAARQGKWLLVNLQSTKEFSSYTLNRDTWAHEAVKDTVSMSFVFWQVYDDTEEGRKVCTYYKLCTMPTTLVLDPLTGQKMRGWEGMIMPDRLLEDLVPYLDRGPLERQSLSVPPQKRPREYSKRPIETHKDTENVDFDEEEELRHALAASLEDVDSVVSDRIESKPNSKVKASEGPMQRDGLGEHLKKEFPILPEEPASNTTTACRVAVCLPDGKRVQRRFLRSDPIQFLWSFCSQHVKDAANGRSFRLTQRVPGAPGALDYSSKFSIEEAGVGNAMLYMAWE